MRTNKRTTQTTACCADPCSLTRLRPALAAPYYAPPHQDQFHKLLDIVEYIIVGVTTIHIGGLGDHHGHGHGHGYDAGAAAATTHNLIGLCTGCLVHGLFSMGRLAELWWFSCDTDAVHTAVFSLKRMATGVAARAVVLVGVITGVGPRSVGWVLAALALTYFMSMGELLVRVVLNKYHTSTTRGKKAKGGTTSSTGIHGKGSEAAETAAAAAATPSSSSTAGGSALGAKQVPMHISFFAHRFGEFMMLMVGESVLSLSTTQVADLDVDVYISVVAGYVVTSAMMFLLYVDVYTQYACVCVREGGHHAIPYHRSLCV